MNSLQTQIILDLGFRPEGLPTLQKYVELLWKSNEELNLFSRKMSFEDLINNHVIDCLLPLTLFPKSVKAVADFGSGGGLPGVMYAIQFPQIQFHLFEKSQKKQNFLGKTKLLAPNISVHGEIPNSLKEMDLIVARAFKPTDVILEMSAAYAQSGGKYFLLKGRDEKIQEELQLARKKFKILKVEVVPLKSPIMDVERHLVLISS